MTEGQSKHGASMRQVNPNKTFAGEYKPLYMLPMLKTMHETLNGTINTLIFETSHETTIYTKHIIKATSNMTCKSLCHNPSKLPFASRNTRRNSSTLPTPINLFEKRSQK